VLQVQRANGLLTVALPLHACMHASVYTANCARQASRVAKMRLMELGFDEKVEQRKDRKLRREQDR
jgi:hypothetical protein